MLNAVLQYHIRQYNTPVSLDMCSNLYAHNIITGCNEEQHVVNYYKKQEPSCVMPDSIYKAGPPAILQLSLTATKDNTSEKNRSLC